MDEIPNDPDEKDISPEDMQTERGQEEISEKFKAQPIWPIIILIIFSVSSNPLSEAYHGGAAGKSRKVTKPANERTRSEIINLLN